MRLPIEGEVVFVNKDPLIDFCFLYKKRRADTIIGDGGGVRRRRRVYAFS
ncbi:hypothetical protein LguiA_028573 [Lonicera macranthoides]